MKKKLLSLTLCVAMAATVFAGCGSEDKDTKTEKKTNAAEENNGGDSKGSDGQCYFLNFKPEAEQVFEEIAKKFTEEEGIDCKVVTAANNQYESTLKAEMAKSDAPTAFIINGPVGYNSWKDYCADIKDTDLYNNLIDKDSVVSTDDGVFGVPIATEMYGLICNKAIFEKYFGLDGIADTGCEKIEDINSFEKLSAVVKDMDAHKDDLDIVGVFSAPTLDSDNNWRIQTHLANLPIHYEYDKDGVSDKDSIDFSFGDNFKNILDLYLDYATVTREQASSGSVDEAMAEFALGECAIVQNGTWGWSQIDETDGNTVKEDDLYFMPIYIGVDGEESQGICAGTENFLAINSKASEADQEASVKFFTWLYTSETGKKYVKEDLGFVSPFEGADTPDNPLAVQGLEQVADSSIKVVPWDFVTIPGQSWKNALGEDLLSYAEGTMDWDKVISNAKESWASEKSAAAE
ncbi:MAG: carbohydrate ABC transporter substrate-binding protein [Lachnospiraceae bacterium]|nr:carbohydrate ABC transporter substrate-binding protein [Lachnospiraceae bacterium]